MPDDKGGAPAPQNTQKPTPSAGQLDEATEKKVLGLIGFAARARRLAIGAEQVCDALRAGHALCVVEAGDTSAATHKRIGDKTSYYRAHRVRLSVPATALGAAVGKGTAVAAVGVTEPHIAAEIRRLTNG